MFRLDAGYLEGVLIGALRLTPAVDGGRDEGAAAGGRAPGHQRRAARTQICGTHSAGGKQEYAAVAGGHVRYGVGRAWAARAAAVLRVAVRVRQRCVPLSAQAKFGAAAETTDGDGGSPV